MNQVVDFVYFGELAALLAAFCWSIAVIIFKSASNKLSPLLITALKNTIALFCFIIFFIIAEIPLWYDQLNYNDYIRIVISGALGMGFGDILFIYALSKIGANRIAILNCFEPAVIYFFSIIMLGTILTFQQFIGFIIVIISILIITYEKDIDDIDPIIKRRGMLIHIFAILLSVGFISSLLTSIPQGSSGMLDIFFTTDCLLTLVAVDSSTPVFWAI